MKALCQASEHTIDCVDVGFFLLILKLCVFIMILLLLFLLLFFKI